MPFDRVAFHDFKLSRCQFSRLIQHRGRHRGLTQVVHQTGQSRQPGFCFVQTELLGQHHHHGAHSHRMQIGVVVHRFQSSQTNQSAWVSHHRVRNFLNQISGTANVNAVAHADFFKHGHHSLLRLTANQGGTLHFVLNGQPNRTPATQHHLLKRSIDFNFSLLFRHDGHRGGDIQSLAAVDPDFFDAACKNNVQIFGIGKHKGSPYERMLHPRATKLLDMHSHGQLSDADAFKHEKQNPVKRT